MRKFQMETIRRGVQLISIEGHVPELLVDAAVDDKVDGGVEDEEDVVGRVQVVDVGRCV